jgi:hypothetical protein
MVIRSLTEQSVEILDKVSDVGERSMSSAFKWFAAQPSPKYRILNGIFFCSWSMMTTLPFVMFLGKADFHESLETKILWAFMIGWAISSTFIFAMFSNSMSLSQRVAQLEQEVTAMRDGQQPSGG